MPAAGEGRSVSCVGTVPDQIGAEHLQNGLRRVAPDVAGGSGRNMWKRAKVHGHAAKEGTRKRER